MPTRHLFLLPALAFLAAPALRADSTTTHERTVTQVADGVYVIRHPDAPDGFPQGNTTVVIGENAVLVVDSCYLPSAAREDIAQIRQWTTKPVRYLVNTHWHYDHQLGNGAYAEAFPGLDIIAHTETRNQIRGYNPGWFEKYPEIEERMKKTLATGIRSNGQPLTAEMRPGLEAALKNHASVSAEFSSQPGRVPNVTFDSEMTVDLGGQQVRLLHLGRGNTAGDAVVFLPKDRLLAMGDLVDTPVPYIGSGFPFDQVGTLEKMLRLEADVYVPGHGEILRGSTGRASIGLLRDFLVDVTTQVSAIVHRLGNNPDDYEKVRAEVEKGVNFDAWRQKFAGDNKVDQDFFDSFPRPGVVQAAFAQTWPR